FRYLHDCSDCFRLERIAGWDLHPLESAALSRRTPIPAVRDNRETGSVGGKVVIPFRRRCPEVHAGSSRLGVVAIWPSEPKLTQVRRELFHFIASTVFGSSGFRHADDRTFPPPAAREETRSAVRAARGSPQRRTA